MGQSLEKLRTLSCFRKNKIGTQINNTEKN